MSYGGGNAGTTPGASTKRKADVIKKALEAA